MTIDFSKLPFRLVQNTNAIMGHINEFRAQSVYWGAKDLVDMADEISNHTSLYSKAEIMGVIYKMQTCLLELIGNGYKVEIGDLGYFYMSVHNARGGVDTRDETAKIDKVSVNFNPHQTTRINYNKKTLHDALQYVNIEDIPGIKDYFPDADDEDGQDTEPVTDGGGE